MQRRRVCALAFTTAIDNAATAESVTRTREEKRLRANENSGKRIIKGPLKWNAFAIYASEEKKTHRAIGKGKEEEG
jgi:hypothetical protein